MQGVRELRDRRDSERAALERERLHRQYHELMAGRFMRALDDMARSAANEAFDEAFMEVWRSAPHRIVDIKDVDPNKIKDANSEPRGDIED